MAEEEGSVGSCEFSDDVWDNESDECDGSSDGDDECNNDGGREKCEDLGCANVKTSCLGKFRVNGYGIECGGLCEEKGDHEDNGEEEREGFEARDIERTHLPSEHLLCGEWGGKGLEEHREGRSEETPSDT